MSANILILHSPLAQNAPADELDVLQQADFFRSALATLGLSSQTFAFPYDLERLRDFVTQIQPQFIVNLIETLFADGRLVHTGPFVLDHLGVKYTGCSAHSIYISSHKLLSKQLMRAHGLPTPVSFTYNDIKTLKNSILPDSFLLKSIWEHASFGMDENKQLLFHSQEELLARFEQEKHPSAFFAEQYIHGREFNLSVLGGKTGPMVLPVAEIRFNYPENKPRILGYKAKWEEESFEFKNTLRSFDFGDQDQPLLQQLQLMALKCWEVFDLRGYARVDFRVDDNGGIYVLEINANPCISSDSGFVAAAQQAGLEPHQVVRNILEDSGIHCP